MDYNINDIVNLPLIDLLPLYSQMLDEQEDLQAYIGNIEHLLKNKISEAGSVCFDGSNVITKVKGELIVSKMDFV